MCEKIILFKLSTGIYKCIGGYSWLMCCFPYIGLKDIFYCLPNIKSTQNKIECNNLNNSNGGGDFHMCMVLLSNILIKA